MIFLITNRNNAEEEKARKEELKEEAKTRKEEEKAAKAEEKRLAKEEKDKHRISGVVANEDTTPEHATEANSEEPTQRKRRLSRPFTPKLQTKAFPSKADKSDPSSLSPDTSPESATESHSARVKNWLKSRLQRPRAKSTSVNSTSGKPERPAGGFIGGHALTRLHADGTGSMTSLSDGNRSASMHEVALAGRPVSALPLARADEEGESYKRHGLVILSNAGDSLSSANSEVGTSVRNSRARTRSNGSITSDIDIDITPPRRIVDPERVVSRSSGSPTRDSKFIEIID